ncbi:hypothetical protein E2562_023302 [Oryza meyeriana var. granulata]|uniref:Uncharacterized protein n=1 Tax=Oryza meyeriana var. granulata TaxID=110450 RepID=A0A6G1DMC1_9ORYZ|nr:hypothetical protein E2562_023302 [Oryza meyeriana var. granulata]
MPLLGGGLPTCRRLPPLFLCRFAATDDADVPLPAGNLVGAGEENCRRIIEILSRGRNPMLVSVGAASADDNFVAASPYRSIHVEPNSIDKSDLSVVAAMASATSRAGERPLGQGRRWPGQAPPPPCASWRV